MPGRGQLLVEGADDRHVCTQLLRHHAIETPPRIEDMGGVHNLLAELPVFLKGSPTETLGIVLDADTDLAVRWQALSDRLRRAGYDCPTEPDPDGTIVEAKGLRRVGTWIMPDNRLPGILEDFMQLLVPDGDELFALACTAVSGIPQLQVRFPESRRPKAELHTWLAWQDEPGKPLGQAILARYLDADRTAAHGFVAWIRRLFTP